MYCIIFQVSDLKIVKLVQWYNFQPQRVFSHDVTAAILVSQTNPVGVELFSYANIFFCSNKFA